MRLWLSPALGVSLTDLPCAHQEQKIPPARAARPIAWRICKSLRGGSWCTGLSCCLSLAWEPGQRSVAAPSLPCECQMHYFTLMTSVSTTPYLQHPLNKQDGTLWADLFIKHRGISRICSQTGQEVSSRRAKDMLFWWDRAEFSTFRGSLYMAFEVSNPFKVLNCSFSLCHYTQQLHMQGKGKLSFSPSCGSDS